MNADTFSKLIQQPSLLNETSAEELEQLIYEYPWFGTAQLLLAAKLKQTGAPNASRQIQKAGVFFNQPLWFVQQLNRFVHPELKSDLQSPIPQPVTDNIPSASILQFSPETEEEKEANDTDALLDAEAIIEVEEIREEQSSPVSDDILNAEVLLEAESTREQEEFIKETEIELDARVLVEAAALQEEDELIKKAEIESNAEAILEAADKKEELSVSAPASTEEKPALLFEPFHTVDYFASQGIKLQENKTGDKLEQQVKSFTQWLRSMKKIYVEEKKELDSSLEQAVISMATESNQQTEIITETMADVLIKQGKHAQAIDLYRKLSLLHPEKSVYFASLIDQLKS